MCSGCGSENISWATESRFTNVTWVPRATVTFCGHTALFAIVIVVDVGPAVQVDVVGAVELPDLPQAASAANPTTATAATAFLRTHDSSLYLAR